MRSLWSWRVGERRKLKRTSTSASITLSGSKISACKGTLSFYAQFTNVRWESFGFTSSPRGPNDCYKLGEVSRGGECRVTLLTVRCTNFSMTSRMCDNYAKPAVDGSSQSSSRYERLLVDGVGSKIPMPSTTPSYLGTNNAIFIKKVCFLLEITVNIGCCRIKFIRLI